MQKYLDIDYETLDSILPNLNIKFGMRNYTIENRGKVFGISFDDMYRLPFLNNYNFINLDYSSIMDIYNSQLRSQKNSNI